MTDRQRAATGYRSSGLSHGDTTGARHQENLRRHADDAKTYKAAINVLQQGSEPMEIIEAPNRSWPVPRDVYDHLAATLTRRPKDEVADWHEARAYPLEGAY